MQSIENSSARLGCSMFVVYAVIQRLGWAPGKDFCQKLLVPALCPARFGCPRQRRKNTGQIRDSYLVITVFIELKLICICIFKE